MVQRGRESSLEVAQRRLRLQLQAARALQAGEGERARRRAAVLLDRRAGQP